MYRIIYSSLRNPQFMAKDIAFMLKSAEENNKKVGISGLLLFGNNQFLQVFEGFVDLF
ncbi:MAG: BLUF domain-containing protein [Nitrospinae bacterium]|nr:BLUF domain-containing protein [Nitrospinota bacterium]